MALMGGSLAIAGIIVGAVAYGLREGLTLYVAATRDVTKDYKSTTIGFSNQQIEGAYKKIVNSTNPHMQNSGPQNQGQNRPVIQGTVSIEKGKSSGHNCGE